MNLPVLVFTVACFGFTSTQIYRDAAVQRAVIEKESLDVFAFISKCDVEFIKPLRSVYLHHVPKDRTAADLDHRLRLDFSFLRKAGSKASGQQYNFHVLSNPDDERALRLGRKNLDDYAFALQGGLLH